MNLLHIIYLVAGIAVVGWTLLAIMVLVYFNKAAKIEKELRENGFYD